MGSVEKLPIEEGLSALTMKPFSIVELKIMAIAMPRINLLNKKVYQEKILK